jgi:hypothetical protein
VHHAVKEVAQVRPIVQEHIQRRLCGVHVTLPGQRKNLIEKGSQSAERIARRDRFGEYVAQLDDSLPDLPSIRVSVTQR